MARMTLAELQEKYPPADQEAYDEARDRGSRWQDGGDGLPMRSHAGLTQAELGRRIGTTRSSIARMEGGGSLPTIEMIWRLAQATGVAVRLLAPGVADVEILAGGARSSRNAARRSPRSAREATTSAAIRRQAERERNIAGETGSERQRA